MTFLSRGSSAQEAAWPRMMARSSRISPRDQQEIRSPLKITGSGNNALPIVESDGANLHVIEYFDAVISQLCLEAALKALLVSFLYRDAAARLVVG
jgi:hypothetical protein